MKKNIINLKMESGSYVVDEYDKEFIQLLKSKLELFN
jgi:hypothetical protein